MSRTMLKTHSQDPNPLWVGVAPTTLCLLQLGRNLLARGGHRAASRKARAWFTAPRGCEPASLRWESTGGFTMTEAREASLGGHCVACPADSPAAHQPLQLVLSVHTLHLPRKGHVNCVLTFALLFIMLPSSAPPRCSAISKREVLQLFYQEKP